MLKTSESVKYTAVLPAEFVCELKSLASKKIIPSVNYGIRLAIENYIKLSKEMMYVEKMKESLQDKAFIKRTLEAQEAFAHIDEEADGAW